MNLFFIHSPFQLLVAQNLIEELNLSDNIFIAGINGVTAIHYYDMYEVLIIDKYWREIIKINNVHDAIISLTEPLSSILKLYKFNRKIENVISKYKPKRIFFGDINCITYLFLYKKLNGKVEINFFEEGTSHYVASILKKRHHFFNWKVFLKQLTTNIIYSPFGAKNMGQLIYTYNEVELHNIKRYSIIPFNGNIHIQFKCILSEKVKIELNKLAESKLDKSKPWILYLSTSATSSFKTFNDEVKYLVSYLNANYKEGVNIYIKFHPKDQKEKKKEVLNLISKQGFRYFELFPNLSYPVELIFNIVHIEELVAWESSSFFYSKMFLPHLKRTTILPSLISDYKAIGEPTEYLEAYIKEIQETSINLFGERINEF